MKHFTFTIFAFRWAQLFHDVIITFGRTMKKNIMQICNHKHEQSNWRFLYLANKFLHWWITVSIIIQHRNLTHFDSFFRLFRELFIFNQVCASNYNANWRRYRVPFYFCSCLFCCRTHVIFFLLFSDETMKLPQI